jgi:hypothetical protein
MPSSEPNDMTEELKELLAKARSITMTPEQERQQRVSFVYGNTNIENSRITKQLVEEIDADMSRKPRTNG